MTSFLPQILVNLTNVSSSCSIVMHTYAVMGVNTAFIQAAIMARVKVHTIVPAKFAAKLDIANGNFKVEAFPVSAPEHIAAVQ